MSNVLTVSGLNLYVKSLLDSDRNLRTLWMTGEISNLTLHRSGHIYLTLKDDRSAVKAVMFAGSASGLRFRPKDGMKVIVQGRVSLYEATGSYQFYIDSMQPDGAGALNLAFEQLKAKLLKEGLFDRDHKLSLPEYPRRVGVITSPTGDAVRDIFEIMKRRYPLAEIVFCPALVQGAGAAQSLTEGIRRFDRIGNVDVIIIGRGGGSAEDLSPFNDETLARAIYDCRIPVVSAVGHETDFTICDFVADVRGSTPSAGAELVSPDMSAMLGGLAFMHRRIREAMQSRLRRESLRLQRIRSAHVLRSPMELVRFRKLRLSMLQERLKSTYSGCVSREKHRFSSLGAKLDALSPLKVLSRGYSVTKKDQRIVRSVREVSTGDELEILLQDGSLPCRVIDREEIPE